jgi:hypothetical protein
MMARLFAAFDNAKKPLPFLPAAVISSSPQLAQNEPLSFTFCKACGSKFRRGAIGRFRALAKNAQTLAPNRVAPF